MNSVDKTSNCILPSSRVSCQYLICKHTIHESLESGRRKSPDNVTQIYCDSATFTSK